MAGAGQDSASPNRYREWLNSPELKELQHAFNAYREQALREDAEWWEGLSYEDKLKAFRCVCRRIYAGDVEQRGSYRYVLYDTFGFDLDAYADGMDCGYMTIHNLIWTGLEAERQRAQRIQDIADEELGSDNKSPLQQEQARRQ